MWNDILQRSMLTLALIGGVSSARGEVICTSDDGPLMSVGSNTAYRLTLTRAGVDQQMELERWGICFRCAGLPSLQLDLRGMDGPPLTVRVGCDVRSCAGESARANKSASDKYCIGSASVWVGSMPSQHCRFPDETTLGELWTALTKTPPPRNIDPWWSFSHR